MQTTDLTKESALFLCSLETMSTDGISSQGSVAESNAMNPSAAEALQALQQMLPSANMAGKTAALDIGSKGAHHPEKEERRTAVDMKGQEGQSMKYMGETPGSPGWAPAVGDRAETEIPKEREALFLCSPLGWFGV